MKHKTFLSIVVAMAMTGCFKVQKKSEVAAKQGQPKQFHAQPQKAPITRELHLDDVFVEFVGQAQPDMYDIVFSWPETRDRVRISIDGQAMFVVNTSERQTEGVGNLQGGRKISVLVEILDQQYHIIAAETRELEVPKDYIFPKNLRLTSDLTIPNERVFMNGSMITTQHYNLTIKTKKLVMLEKSYIQNFSSDEKASPNKPGRNGGTIRIEALAAEGNLDLTLNSEAGGDGFKGLAPCSSNDYCSVTPSCPVGGRGMDAGRNGDLYVKINNSTDFKLYYQEELARGGNVGPGPNIKTADGYPVFVPYGAALGLPNMNCEKNPLPGIGAQSGKICLTYSGQMPQLGCE